ncbi:c-type cytochrome [Sphingobium nicotianae]|uniref:C-type cytochrome n=1 Tax=Sphingobium nicotianae TaxID=2782607 RepID=A0A9X1DDN6_9SPHN|nr:cytochrome c [Sphingobium nicotianae]MBT2187608.1 c-type cytochrome [Sphingobium nicotianae]
MARALSVIALAATAIAIGAASPAPITTRQGVFTEDQAAAGAQLYATRCAMCHGKMREGTYETPSLQDRFIANWSKAPVADLYDYLARAMPQFAPGSLKPAETAQIVAYLLKANGLPAGAKPLPEGGPTLARIMLEPKAPSLSAKAVPRTK